MKIHLIIFEVVKEIMLRIGSLSISVYFLGKKMEIWAPPSYRHFSCWEKKYGGVWRFKKRYGGCPKKSQGGGANGGTKIWFRFSGRKSVFMFRFLGRKSVFSVIFIDHNPFWRSGGWHLCDAGASLGVMPSDEVRRVLTASLSLYLGDTKKM